MAKGCELLISSVCSNLKGCSSWTLENSPNPVIDNQLISQDEPFPDALRQRLSWQMKPKEAGGSIMDQPW